MPYFWAKKDDESTQVFSVFRTNNLGIIHRKILIRPGAMVTRLGGEEGKNKFWGGTKTLFP